MFIIYNKDGSIYARTQSDFVMQGSNRVNKVFIGFVDNEYSGWSCNAVFNLPNNTRWTIPAVPANNGFEYLGVQYQGWVIELTSDVTKYAGNVSMTVQVANESTHIAYSYLANITINQTGLPLDGYWDDSITVAQFNDYMAQLAVKLQANTVSVVVAESELPETGMMNVLYFVLGATSNEPYQVKMWNGSEYTVLGTINLSSFASKEEQARFELALTNRQNGYEDEVDAQIEQIRNEVVNPFVVVSTTSQLPSTNQGKIYVVLENNHWYYWNGSSYVDSGKKFIDSTLDAVNVNYSNNNSKLSATNVQEAIDEAYSNIVKNNLFLDIGNKSITARGNYVDLNLYSGVISLANIAERTFTLIFSSQEFANVTSKQLLVRVTSVTAGGNKFFSFTDENYVEFTLPDDATEITIFKVTCGGHTDSDSTITLTNVKLLYGSTKDQIVLQREVKLDDKVVSVVNTNFIDDNKIFVAEEIVLQEYIAANKYKPLIQYIPKQENETIYVSVGSFESLNCTGFIYRFVIDDGGTTINSFFTEISSNSNNNFAFMWSLPSNTKRVEIGIYLSGSASADKKLTVKDCKISKGLAVYELEENVNLSKTIYKNYNLPILYLNGGTASMTKDDSVDLTYKYGELIGTCNVKWQGTSSIAFPKKNYTIKFDNAFEAKEGWGSQKKYCLKANWVDRTHSRNIVSARLWGEVVKSRTDLQSVGLGKLETLPNAGAVDGFPISLVIDGIYQGIYTFNIPKDGWMLGMGSGTREAILSAEGTSPAGFISNPVLGTDFDIEYVTDENDTSWLQTALNDIYNVIQTNDLEQIAALVDIQSIIDYVIFTELLNNHDGRIKNYLLCKYDNSKWFVTAYDLDLTFGNNFNDYELGKVNLYMVNNLFTKVIKLVGNDVVEQRYEKLVNDGSTHTNYRYDSLLSSFSVAKKFNDFAYSIPRVLYDEDSKIWKSLPSTYTDTIDRCLWAYTTRMPLVLDWIKNLLY